MVTGWNCTLQCFTTCCSRMSLPVDLLLLVTSLTFWRLIRHKGPCFRNLRNLYTASSYTIPVATCVAERSFSGLQRPKTYLRATMSQVRLNSTALLHCHRVLRNDLYCVERGVKLYSLTRPTSTTSTWSPSPMNLSADALFVEIRLLPVLDNRHSGRLSVRIFSLHFYLL